MGNGLSDDLDIDFGAGEGSIDSVSLPDMANCRMALRSSVTFSSTEYRSPKCWVIKAQASSALLLPVVSSSCESAAACVATGLSVREMATIDDARLWITLDGAQIWED